MNRKQIVSMWCGIVAVVLWAFVTGHCEDFGVGVLLIGLIVGGLILSFRDKKVTNKEQEYMLED